MTFTSYLVEALVPYRCCDNKLPKTVWLKTTEIYSLTVLKARV